MAKKGKTGNLGFFAFLAVCLNALAWVLKAIDSQWHIKFLVINGKSIIDIITGISALILLLVVIFVAHDFAERQSTIWRVLFWIFAILAGCAILFGSGANFFK